MDNIYVGIWYSRDPRHCISLRGEIQFHNSTSFLILDFWFYEFSSGGDPAFLIKLPSIF